MQAYPETLVPETAREKKRFSGEDPRWIAFFVTERRPPLVTEYGSCG
jgi:hypothetical protein